MSKKGREKISYSLNSTCSGMGLLEVVFSLAIVMIILTGLVSSFQFFLKAGFLNTERIQSAFLLEEGLEVVRFKRDSGWTNITSLAVDTPYYFYRENNNWLSTTIATTTSGFTRTITFYDTYRRTSDDVIVASTSPDSKSIDSEIRMVTVKVITPLLSEKKMSTYITNLFDT